MLTGTRQALAWRVALLMALALTAALGRVARTPATHAQTAPEGLVRLTPAMSTVPGDGGAFTVYVVAENLQHHGALTYDDNRDGTPDRIIPSEGLGAFQITLEYDPSVVSIEGAEAGPDLGRSGRAFQCLPPDRKPGNFSFACASFGADPAGTQGTLTLASVTLVPRGQGLSPLSIDAEIVGPLGDAASITVSGGAARVEGAVKQPTPPESSSTLVGGGATPTQPLGSGITETAPAQTGTLTPPATASTVPAPKPTGGPGAESRPRADGRSFGGATLWSAIVVGSVVAGGLLALAAMVWRQRQHRGEV